MSIPDLFTAAERRLAVLVFVLSAVGLLVRAGRGVSPEVAAWLDEATTTPPDTVSATAPVAVGPGARSTGTASSTSTEILATVNPNTATVEELQALPGIGPALAGRILADRARNGPYGRPRDLLRVSGIGPTTLRRIVPYLKLP